MYSSVSVFDHSYPFLVGRLRTVSGFFRKRFFFLNFYSFLSISLRSFVSFDKTFSQFQFPKHNSREQKRSAKSIISLVDNNCLVLNHPEDRDQKRRFVYDRIFWSHDGFTEAQNGLLVADPNHTNGAIFADQVGSK